MHGACPLFSQERNSSLVNFILLLSSIWNIASKKLPFLNSKKSKENNSTKGEHMNLTISTLKRVFLAIGWIVAAQLILSVIAFSLYVLISWTIGLKFILWTPDIKMTYELLITAGFHITISLGLLFTTKNIQPLNRSMLWLLTGWAIWHLLNASLPVIGMKPIYYDSFFFHNIKELSGLFFTAGLIVNSIANVCGIALYLIWKSREKRRKLE